MICHLRNTVRVVYVIRGKAGDVPLIPVQIDLAPIVQGVIGISIPGDQRLYYTLHKLTTVIAHHHDSVMVESVYDFFFVIIRASVYV